MLLDALFDEADASNMPSFGLVSAHQKHSNFKMRLEIVTEIVHSAVAVAELFGGACWRPFEGHFAQCGVFADVRTFCRKRSANIMAWRGSGAHFYMSRMQHLDFRLGFMCIIVLKRRPVCLFCISFARGTRHLEVPTKLATPGCQGGGGGK